MRFEVFANVPMESDEVPSSTGSLFHVAGPDTAKLRRPMVGLVPGTTSVPLFADRMAVILFLFDVSVSVCMCVCVQRTGQSDQFKTVKATDFRFDTHVPRDGMDMTPKFFENVAWPGSRYPLSIWVLNANG